MANHFISKYGVIISAKSSLVRITSQIIGIESLKEGIQTSEVHLSSNACYNHTSQGTTCVMPVCPQGKDCHKDGPTKNLPGPLVRQLLFLLCTS